MKIGTAINRMRIIKEITQTELSIKTGISQTYISQIENNRKNPSIEVLETISKALDVPLPILLFYSMDQEDVKEQKQKHFLFLKPILEQMILSII